MILITGATGQFGAKAVEHLLSKGTAPADLSVLVRDAAKAQPLADTGIDVRIGNYTDRESLIRAFRGVDKLLLVSSSDRNYANRTAHHRTVIEAAKAAGIPHIAYTSFVRMPGYETSAIAQFQDTHVKTEEALKDSGITYTILRNGIYLEMIPVFIGDIGKTGTIALPAGEGRASWVLREELAEAAAHVLTTTGHENRVYTLTNEKSASYGDIAAAMSDTLGSPVQYQSLEVEAFENRLRETGVPEGYIGAMTTWALAQAQGMLELPDATLASFLGRQPATLGRFVERVYG